jgi:hypothetical protein
MSQVHLKYTFDTIVIIVPGIFLIWLLIKSIFKNIIPGFIKDFNKLKNK